MQPKILTYTKHGVLTAAGLGATTTQGVRICPWNTTFSHMGDYTALLVTATLTTEGVATLVGRFFECNLGTNQPINPEVLRDTDRTGVPLDTLTVLDSTTSISLGQHVVLFEKAQSIAPLVIPTFKLPRDDQSVREWFVAVENVAPVPVRYTIELTITPTCVKC